MKSQTNGAYRSPTVLVTVVRANETAFATAIDVRPPRKE